jgi:hypothetical protein
MSDLTPVLDPIIGRRPVGLDFETYYDDKCSVVKLGVDAYCRHPDFDPYLIAVTDGNEKWVGEPKDFNFSALEGETVVSHNAGFDRQVFHWGVRNGKWDDVRYKEWHCTANLSAYLCDHRSLSSAVEHLFGRKLSKDVRDRAKTKRVADMKREGWWDDMIAYGASDTVECQRIFADFGHLWPTYERRLSELTYKQCSQGVFVDKERLHDLKQQAQIALIKAETALPWLETNKPTSTKAIAEECRKHGIPCPPIKSHSDDGEELFEEWQTLFAPRFPWVQAVTAWRRLNKFVGFLEKIEERLRPDGSMGFELKFYGAHTGRWSGGGGLNMLNLRKIPLLLDSEWKLNLDDDRDVMAAQQYEDTQTWPEWVAHVLDVRGVFIPKPGMKFVISDLSQIEPRVLNWLVGNYEFLELLKGGMALYEAHARATMGWTGGVLKKESKDKYAMAKARVLALGYGAGWEKFIGMAFTYAGVKLDEATSRSQVTQFREDNPLIVKGWNKLDDQFRAAVGGDFHIELPNGRKLNYHDVKRSVRTRQDKKTKEITKSFEYTARTGDKRASFYGGKLMENATQAAARDVFCEGLLRLEDAGIHSVWTIYDETVTQVPLDTDPEDVRGLMAQTPDWLSGCPIDATAENADRYKK